MLHNVRRRVGWVAAWACALALVLALVARTTPALAVEGRCPTGWSTLPVMGNQEQIMIAACARRPMELVASELSRPIAPNDPNERSLIDQITGQIGQGGEVTASPIRTETWGGVSVRVTDVQGTSMNEDGTQGRVEGSIVLIALARTTVLVFCVTRDVAAGNARTAIRAFVPTLVGLGATPTPWRASATCPSDLPAWPSQGLAPGGLRRVLRCGSPDASQLDVLESHLPIRTPEDARVVSDLPAAAIRRALVPIGGNVQVEPVQNLTFGTQRAYVVALHGSAVDPRMPPGGAPGGGSNAIRIEGYVAVVPIASGHVRVIAIGQTVEAAALATQVRNFVANNLRTDGTGVVEDPTPAPGSGPTPTPGGGTDPGANRSSSSASQPPPQRQRAIDPSVPLWQPEQESRPRSSSQDSSRRGCGCRVPGAAEPRRSHGIFVGCLALVFASLRRRSTRRR